MQKLILRNWWSPGDLVMLSAAVRDLLICHPGRFQVDVRTACPQLWEHNPHITPLNEADPDVRVLDCRYPLINVANRRPYHCLHGFIRFLNEQLGLCIEPTAFKGDIHLSAQEKAWYSQVHELTRQDVPFWIVAAGGKHDVTIKWWSHERYQQVVDFFRGRILFVQVGARGHHHPRLDGAIDLRGRTDLRQLIRLVYHSQGILCGVTALMHLAAAVETRPERQSLRPCVVVAGGREPPHWEAYPGHQFLHTIGALECCRYAGCWRDRTFPLGDGDHRDLPRHRCRDVRNGLPHCMDMITVEEVCRAIERYFADGIHHYLEPSHLRPAARGLRHSSDNPYDDQPLNFHSMRAALEGFVRDLPKHAPCDFAGRGIVICAGGACYLTNAWVCIHLLRQHGCRLPVQVWHLGEEEIDPAMAELLRPLGVECVDAGRLMEIHPVRRTGGWALKSYALLHCPFAEVLFLDADNMPVRDPENLFDAAEFKRTGAVFWPDYGTTPTRTVPIWRACRLRTPTEKEFESGQMLFDRNRCWRALRLSLWFNEHSDFFYRHTHGDKETFHFAFRKLRTPYHLVETPIKPLAGIMCQHDLDGRRVFQHRNTDKWNFLMRNRRVRGFRLDEDCRRYLRELRKVWDGGMDRFPAIGRWFTRTRRPKIAVVLIGKNVRLERRLTMREKAEVSVVSIEREARAGEAMTMSEFGNAAKASLSLETDYALFLEADVRLNRFLMENLHRWKALRTGSALVASLTNPGFRETACSLELESFVMKPEHFIPGGGFLLRKDALSLFARKRRRGQKSVRSLVLGFLKARKQPLFQHMPSLVQPRNRRHPTQDFDSGWRHETCG